MPGPREERLETELGLLSSPDSSEHGPSDDGGGNVMIGKHNDIEVPSPEPVEMRGRFVNRASASFPTHRGEAMGQPLMSTGCTRECLVVHAGLPRAESEFPQVGGHMRESGKEGARGTAPPSTSEDRDVGDSVDHDGDGLGQLKVQGGLKGQVARHGPCERLCNGIGFPPARVGSTRGGEEGLLGTSDEVVEPVQVVERDPSPCRAGDCRA